MTDLPLGSLTETTYAGPDDPIYLEFGGNSRRITKRNLLGSSMVTPYDYGAVPGQESAVDNHSYVQAMFDACAASYNSTLRTYELTPRFAGMRFRCDDEVWVGGLRDPGMMIFGEGGGIYSQAAGKIAFNMALCNRVFVHGFTVWGDETNAPDYGIYYGRGELSGAWPDARGITMVSCMSQGYFNRAGRLAFASETRSEVNCLWQNRSRSLTAVADACVGHVTSLTSNLGGTLSSANVTLPTVASGSHSNIGHELTGVTAERTSDASLNIVSIPRGATTTVTVESGTLAGANFSNGDKVRFPTVTGMTELRTGEYTIANLNEGADTFDLAGVNSSAYGADGNGGRVWAATGPAALFNGMLMTEAQTYYPLAYADVGIVVDLSIGGDTRSFHMRCQPESKTDYFMEFILPSSPSTAPIQDFQIVNVSNSQIYDQAIFKVTGTGALTIQGGKIHITNLASAPPSLLFDNPANVSLLNMELQAPIEAVFNDAGDYTAYEVQETAFDRFPKTKEFRSVAFESNPQFVTDTLATAALTAKATDATATAGPIFDIYRDSASPAVNDLIGSIQFSGENDADQKVAYVKLRGQIVSATDGSETGSLDVILVSDGTERAVFTVDKENVIVTNTDAGANTNPRLILDRNSASPANSDVLGEYVMTGRNNAGESIRYALINGNIKDITDGDEEGELVFGVIIGGVETSVASAGISGLKSLSRPVQTNIPATSTQLDDAGDPINTVNKEAGKMVWNTTTASPVWASGAGPTSAWKDATGTDAHTPS